MTAAEFPELELAFGRALRRGDALHPDARARYFEGLALLMHSMQTEAGASLFRAREKDYRAVSEPVREELPESDPEGNDKVKDERPNFKCSREAHP